MLEAYRPSPALGPSAWSAYVDELLGGAHSEPFYTGDEKKGIEAAFFADAAVQEQLAASPFVPRQSRGAFFSDPKNWSKLWRESLTESTDEALRARFAVEDTLWRSFATQASRVGGRPQGGGGAVPPYTGVVVDCGSGPSGATSASRSLRRALLTPQVNAGSLYSCGRST